MPALLGLVLRAWEAHTLAGVATAWEPAGVPCAGLWCVLVGVMRDNLTTHQEKIHDSVCYTK